jgi:glycosyltransferase involved in cell wall biosynthesis
MERRGKAVTLRPERAGLSRSRTAQPTKTRLTDEKERVPRPLLLFVVNVDWFFVSHRLQIAEAAIRAGYEVHLACSTTGSSQRLKDRGITVHHLNIRRRQSSFLKEMRTVGELISLFRKLEPDIVHLVTIKPVLLGGIAARIAGVRNVVSAISGLGYVFISQGLVARLRRLVVNQLYRAALGRNTAVIFQNDADAALITGLAKLKPRQVRMIRGSGIDLVQLRPTPLPDGPTVLTFAARLLNDKGLREFIEAAYLLKSEGISARFWVAGDPDPENPASVTSDQLHQWKQDGVVEFIGHQKEIGALFARCHVVVLPSYREGFPKVLMEAAACGRATITADVPGCRDAVAAGVTGLLVPPMKVKPLADAMKGLIRDRELCAKMGAAGRKLAEEAFDINQVVDAHFLIYSDLIGAGR